MLGDGCDGEMRHARNDEEYSIPLGIQIRSPMTYARLAR